MKNFVICKNATDTFREAYQMLERDGEVVESRIGKVKHLTNITFCVENPLENVCLDATRNLSLRYLLGEILWYLNGSNSVEEIGKYGKMWYDLTDDGVTVNSAYGYTIFHRFGFNQLEYCIKKLKENKYDRQAVIHLKMITDEKTKDMPCTCILQFNCMNDKLNLHTYMRSNDVWFGLPYDIAFFMLLLQIVANECSLSLGKYFHTVGDLHSYEKHWCKELSYESYEGYIWDFSLEGKEDIFLILNEHQKPKSLSLQKLYERCK